jgi:hypothetical protein
MKSRYAILQSGLKSLFTEKHLSQAQVAKVLEYARKSIFGHLQLYLTCIQMKKQQIKSKQITLFAEMPQTCESPNLNTECREIVDEQPRVELQSPNEADPEAPDTTAQEEEKEDVVDPDDPLYGLEQRLRGMDLDEESKRVIRDKLVEASNKIKQGLEQRQANLEAKINAAAPAKKK